MRNTTSTLTLLFTILFWGNACTGTQRKTTDDETTAETQQHEMMDTNLLQFHQIWEAAADTYGSTFSEGDPFINDERLKVDFTIVKKEGEYYPFVELKCFPEIDYSELNKISISYECDHGLIIKLNQSDFSADGDQTYAHYQHAIPATDGEPHTITISVDDFVQPDWAPESSRTIALKREHVQAIYLVPAVDYEKGESTTLEIYSLSLSK